jgi:hypothetical protein
MATYRATKSGLARESQEKVWIQFFSVTFQVHFKIKFEIAQLQK